MCMPDFLLPRMWEIRYQILPQQPSRFLQRWIDICFPCAAPTALVLVLRLPRTYVLGPIISPCRASNPGSYHHYAESQEPKANQKPILNTQRSDPTRHNKRREDHTQQRSAVCDPGAQIADGGGVSPRAEQQRATDSMEYAGRYLRARAMAARTDVRAPLRSLTRRWPPALLCRQVQRAAAFVVCHQPSAFLEGPGALAQRRWLGRRRPLRIAHPGCAQPSRRRDRSE